MGLAMLIISILENAAAVLKLASTGGIQADAAIAEALLKIVQSGATAYQQQTGQPIDPSLLKPIDPVA